MVIRTGTSFWHGNVNKLFTIFRSGVIEFNYYSVLLAPAPISVQRKYDDNASATARAQQKNSLAILNELQPGSIYKLESHTGPAHAPNFRMSVVVSTSNALN